MNTTTEHVHYTAYIISKSGLNSRVTKLKTDVKSHNLEQDYGKDVDITVHLNGEIQKLLFRCFHLAIPTR